VEINAIGSQSHSYPMKRIPISILALLALFSLGSSLSGQEVVTEHVTLELVAENNALIPGQKNTVAVRLKMDDHWHTYWANPGDSGLPTEIAWTLPEGITAGPIQWPAPQWIDYFEMVSYAYEGEVFLLVDLEVPGGFEATGQVDLAARVDFLVCKEACIPGGADLTLSLPISAEASAGPDQSRIQTTRKQSPAELPDWEMRVVDNGESFALSVLAPEGQSLDGREVTYFSLDGWIAPSKPRTSLAEGRVLTIVMPKTEYAPEEGKDQFQGVLVSDKPWDAAGDYQALAVSLTYSANEEVASWLASAGGGNTRILTGSNSDASSAGTSKGFITLLLFAVTGGLLLNLMPCVFPVLSIKVLGFVQQAGEDKSKVKIHGMVFTGGVIVSFWVLAGIFLALRSAGQEIGWGFHLQAPGFVAVLTSIIFLFGLNLSGVFEIGESLTGAGSDLQGKSGYSGSFFSGVLATLVATPCTAPFMGTAVGVIATLSAVKSMAIFTALAIGVALPYLILSFFPAFLNAMPRPGAWMETFKKALAFLLYGTVVWLAWVFGNQVGVNGMGALLMGLVIMGIAAWVWGYWGSLAKRKSVRTIAFVVALPLLCAGGYLQYWASGLEPPQIAMSSEKSDAINWQAYSPETVSAMVADGKTVYVDFTATWCLTCQVNKKVAFGSDEVIQYFKENDIVALKGDWTRRDPVISRELQRFKRNGVPTNIIYRPGGEDTLLPEVLTPGIVLDALREG
jgi:thiol:disulfide interchange protein/DsbC/DsbD-like thiol-disulfide interchange protein